MIIQHTGIVRKVYKDDTGFWCIEIKRTGTAIKGMTKHIGLKNKPKVKEGDRIFAGQEIL